MISKGRLQPGRMFLVDTAAGRIVEDDEVKSALAAEHPYEDWLHAGPITLDDLPEPGAGNGHPPRRGHRSSPGGN